MFWLLALLLGGAYLVSASGGVSTVPNRRVLYSLDPVDADYEKFEDPLYECYGIKDTPYVIGEPPRAVGLGSALNRSEMNGNQPNVIVGYEYLSSVKRDATSRIRAIRFKVETYKMGNAQTQPWFWLPTPGGAVRSSIGTIFSAAVKTSKSKLNHFADTVADTYKKVASDVKAATNFASAYGVDVQAVKDEAASVASSSLDSIELIDHAAKQYGPIADATMRGLNQVLESSIFSNGSNPGAADQKIADALNLVGTIASAFPGYGTIIAIAVQSIGQLFSNSGKVKDDECQAVREKIYTRAEETAKEGYVIPWHFDQVFPPEACFEYSGVGATGSDNMSDDQYSALSLLRKNMDYQAGRDSSNPDFSVVIDPNYRNSIRKWWALTQLWMQHPKVNEVFAALGRDAAGGVIASDEQVMLVAAPYAVANGFDVDQFAMTLYKISAGWRGAEERFMWKTPAMAKYSCYGSTVPANAWWLQWAILANDAELLVKFWREHPPMDVTTNIGPVDGKLDTISR